MQVDRQKFQQCNVEITRIGGSLPEPSNPRQDRIDPSKNTEKRKVHPKAYEDGERWDGMS